MIKERAGKYPFANAKREVRLAGNFDAYFGKRLTDVDEASASLRCRGTFRGIDFHR
jgi:hypothetical protein